MLRRARVGGGFSFGEAILMRCMHGWMDAARRRPLRPRAKHFARCLLDRATRPPPPFHSLRGLRLAAVHEQTDVACC